MHQLFAMETGKCCLKPDGYLSTTHQSPSLKLSELKLTSAFSWHTRELFLSHTKSSVFDLKMDSSVFLVQVHHWPHYSHLSPQTRIPI